MIFGKATTCHYSGNFFAYDMMNNLFIEFSWDNEKKISKTSKTKNFLKSLNPFGSKDKKYVALDLCRGTIYRVQESFLERFLARKNYEESTFDPEYDMLEKLEDVECVWTKYVKIGEKYYWRINEAFTS